jgi:hypothetical protein
MLPSTRRRIRTIGKSFGTFFVGLSIAACGGGGDDPRQPTQPGPTVGSVALTPANPAPIAAGGTLQLTGTVLSTTGQPMSGQITYSSSAPNIATVSGQGLVSSLGPVGGATITGAVGSISTGVPVTVIAGAATSLTRTSADPSSVSPGGTTGDSVRFVVRDAFANPRAGETITFSVTAGGGDASPTTAVTDALGHAATRFTTGTTPGPNTLTATVGGVAPHSFSVNTAAGSVVISSITPTLMTPGATVTIAGSGFNATAVFNAVSINGHAATVTSATPTELIISVPPMPCTPTHQANVQVSANGASATRQNALRVGALQNLAVGGAVVLSSASDLNCTELPASAQYAVNVLNTSLAPASTTPFRFSGSASIPAATTSSVRGATLRQSAQKVDFSRQDAARRILGATTASRHGSMLESNRVILNRMKSRSRQTPQKTATSGSRVMAAAVPVVGELRSLRLLNPSTFGGGGCSDFVEITAKVVYVGARGVIWEDVTAPLAGQMDSYFTQIGQEFDAEIYPTVNTYFADPLGSDQVTDSDGHLSMVFTPAIPAGVSGFVTGCDFSPRNTTDNQVGNFGEYFYAVVPTIAGSGFAQGTADSWLRTMRPTIAHEVKHIAAVGAFITNPARTSFEQSWLEEGMAMVAEELWARDWVYAGATWKGNMAYATTLFCDIRPTTCSGAPFVMVDHYFRLYDYLDAPGATSLFGGGSTFYGVSWSFIRYNVDRYAASEAAYLRGITNSTLTGTANIAAQSGADANQILGMWSLALYLEERSAMAGNVDVRFPSWHTTDIFESLNRDLSSQGLFPKTHPLVPPIMASDFTVDNAGIRGGSFSPYSLLSASGTTRTIGLSTAGGGPAPASLLLVVARTQ